MKHQHKNEKLLSKFKFSQHFTQISPGTKIRHFAIPTEHAQNIDYVRRFGDKHNDATVHFQWSELCRFHKNILYLNFADCLGFTPS